MIYIGIIFDVIQVFANVFDISRSESRRLFEQKALKIIHNETIVCDDEIIIFPIDIKQIILQCGKRKYKKIDINDVLEELKTKLCNLKSY